jgi:isopentenyl diphosphate isomerase/L-lactate dehydrogenase-like FMN-dependent dehydrogenase
MVMLGRSVLYALAGGGERGLQQWLTSMREELEVALSQLGLSRIQDVGPHNLASVPFAQR